VSYEGLGSVSRVIQECDGFAELKRNKDNSCLELYNKLGINGIILLKYDHTLCTAGYYEEVFKESRVLLV